MSKTIEAAEQALNQQPALDIPVGADVKRIKRTRNSDGNDEILVAPAEGLDNGYAAHLAFMEEKMEIMVHESTDANAEPIVQVGVNGINQFFPRGEPVQCKRKFVEVLARARETSISTQTITTDRDVINRINRHTALRYPFSVIRDENPKGAAWLKSVLASA